MARCRHHRHRFTFQERIKVSGLFASHRFALLRLVSVWVYYGFHYSFRLVLLVSPSPRLCLVSFVLLVSPSPRLCLVFIMGFIGGWELCQYRWTNCYESQEDEGADIKGEP